MATTTLLQLISNQNVFSPLVSGVVAALVALSGQYYFSRKNREEEKYQKLYGPLIYHLLMMRLMTGNRENLTNEIFDTLPVGSRSQELREHVDPLVKQWNEHKENVLILFETHPGYIKNGDLKLVEDFLDGCIKRKITENGRNEYTSEERVSKILEAIRALQEKLLP